MRYKVEDEAREQCVKTRAICEDEARRRDEVQRQEAQRCRGIIVCTTKAGKGIPRHRDCRCAGAMHRRRIQFGIGGARRHGDCQRIGGVCRACAVAGYILYISDINSCCQHKILLHEVNDCKS